MMMMLPLLLLLFQLLADLAAAASWRVCWVGPEMIICSVQCKAAEAAAATEQHLRDKNMMHCLYNASPVCCIAVSSRKLGYIGTSASHQQQQRNSTD
jgi:hypothetical protein